MNLSTQHKYTLLDIVQRSPNGIRIDTILKNTGMSPSQLSVAANGLSTKIEKYRGKEGGWGYRLARAKVVTKDMPTRREAVPMHALAPYMGEKPTHRVSL